MSIGLILSEIYGIGIDKSEMASLGQWCLPIEISSHPARACQLVKLVLLFLNLTVANPLSPQPPFSTNMLAWYLHIFVHDIYTYFHMIFALFSTNICISPPFGRYVSFTFQCLWIVMLYHFPIFYIGLKMKLHLLDQTRRGETDICDSFVKYRCCFPWRMPGIRCITIFWSKVKSENVGTASERAATTQHFPKTKASSSVSCSIITSACMSSNLTH